MKSNMESHGFVLLFPIAFFKLLEGSSFFKSSELGGLRAVFRITPAFCVCVNGLLVSVFLGSLVSSHLPKHVSQWISCAKLSLGFNVYSVCGRVCVHGAYVGTVPCA